LLSTNTINIAANANPFTFPSTVDVSAYSSLIAKISTTKTSGGATAQTLAAGAFMTITISQNNTSTPTVLALSKNAQFTFPPTGATDNNTNQTLQTAVTGKYATIAGTVFQTAAGYFVGTATLELYGSYETISQDRYSNIFTPLTTIPGAPLAGIMLAEITTATSTDYDISSKNNIATITLASGSTTNTRSALNISTYYSGASYFLTNLALVSPGLTTLDYGEKDNVTFPMLPVHVTFRQTGATPQSRYSVVQ
jgi:hypothetical protein